MRFNKQGSPIDRKVSLHYMKGMKKLPAKVRAHPVWKNEDKPWGIPRYPRKSQHSSSEAHYLYRTVKELGIGNYANLGVYKGGSVNCMATALRELGGGKVYAVDLFNKINGAEHVETLEEIFRERGTLPYTQFCQGYTHHWPERLKHLKFKFIFIDADHYYESCKQDFELWSPLLESDGVISFHDVHMTTVDKAINELGPEWEMIEHIYRIKSFRRKA